MNQSLLQTAGVGDEIRADLHEAALVLQRPLVLWVGLAILVPVAWFIHRRHRQNLATVPAALRTVLTMARVAILALLVLVLAGPHLRLDQRIEKRPILAWVFDTSQSMSLRAGPFAAEKELAGIAVAAGYSAEGAKIDPETRNRVNQVGRAKLVQEVIRARHSDLLKDLGERYDLRFYAAGDELDRLPVAAPEWELPELKPSANTTRIGDAVSHLAEDAAGRQIAGIVVFSDGQNNAGRSLAEASRAAANVAAPVFAVPPGSDAPVRDVILTDVFAPDLVSVGDTVHVSATMELQGYARQPVKVTLSEENEKQPLDAKDLVLRDTEPQTVDLAFEAKRPGPRTLTVRVSPTTPLPEDLPENNSDSVVVRVSDEKLKVLYVEGEPRWQFRFLKNAMRRDHGLAGLTTDMPDVVLETEARRRASVAALPAKLDDLAKYHVVILGDASPQFAGGKFAEMLSEAVRMRGVGLIVAAGPLAMPGRFTGPLVELLPVRLRPGTSGMEAAVYKPFRVEVSPEGAIHETMRLYDDPGRNDRVWAQMPSFFWCAAVERPAAGATVLAFNASVSGGYGKLPLVAHHYAGKGRVLFLGTDSTWVWRQNVGDRFFYRFWGQAIRFVARRNEEELKKKNWLEARPARAQPGETVHVELMAFHADDTPRRDRSLSVRISGPDANHAGSDSKNSLSGTAIELAADRTVPGRYSGKFLPETAGSFRLSYSPPDGAPPAEARVQVVRASEEFRRPNINVAGLSQLGQVVKLDELSSIRDKLKGEARVTTVHREASLWDNWLVLSVLVCVYCVEVGLRRMTGLS